MKKSVSVIVPFYNAGKYFADCLNCLVSQTLPDLEIILVNDASTDDSGEVARRYQMQYPDRIAFIDSKVNQGAGGARNQGILAAKGIYLGFVDSDDLIEPAMYEKLYHRACETGADIVDCGYYKQEDDTAMLHMGDDLTGELDDRKRSGLIVSGGYIVSKIFHRRLFAEDGWQFRKHAILEDSDFLTYLFATASKTANVKEILYYYRAVESSSSKVIDTGRYFTQICGAIRGIYGKVSDLGNYPAIQDAVEYEMLQMYSYGVNICIRALLGGEDAKENRTRLEMIAALKSNCVKKGYDNPYVQAKISPEDIVIMHANDMGVDVLLEQIVRHLRKE